MPDEIFRDHSKSEEEFVQKELGESDELESSQSQDSCPLYHPSQESSGSSNTFGWHSYFLA